MKHSFLDGYSGYQISITLRDRYKTTFVTTRGAFMWKATIFGVKNGPPIY
jgi:hypothetical protein